MFKTILWALGFTPLLAQGFSGGVHINGEVAVGSLKSDETAGTQKAVSASVGGFHLAYGFNGLDELAMVVNSAGWKGDSISPLPDYSLTNDYTFLQVGLDWRHRFGPAPTYGFVGGLNLTRAEHNATLTVPVSMGGWGSTRIYTQSGRLGFKAGAFYRPARWFSLEGTLNHVLLEKKEGTPERLGSASWIQFSAIFHFGAR